MFESLRKKVFRQGQNSAPQQQRRRQRQDSGRPGAIGLHAVQQQQQQEQPVHLQRKTEDNMKSPERNADEQVPRRPARSRRRSSIVREEQVAELEDLPLLQDTPSSRKEEIFRKKLKLCCVIFNFEDASSNKRGKEIKRSTLLELVDYVNDSGGHKVFTEAVMPDVIEMVSVNLFRPLPPTNEEFDPDEDEPVLDPAWPHLQAVYEFLLRFVVSDEVKAKTAKKYLGHRFCLKIIQLFDTEDPRERDYLKTILHRLYGKFMTYRTYIRRVMANTFYQFVYETGKHNGIGELLEILGSIINGFALPLKPEHKDFLQNAIMPLHRPKSIANYHQQLSYCVTQFIEKESETASTILKSLSKMWPWTNSSKQVLLLNELEEILELLPHHQIEQNYEFIFKLIARLVGSPHFQVAERTLYLWNSDQLLDHGIFSSQYTDRLLPIVFPPLYQNATNHWNGTVEQLAASVLQHYQNTEPETYERCLAREQAREKAKEDTERDHERKWDLLEEMAKENSPIRDF
eukprot:gb/GECG01001907.1/.p1 GENE.gb/GECG01001907.1/~~gb/GECG01001907.1/.p1  ORF type:complete len:516 (+),score=74.21 gb/GECG01001907.1/:1-1548(+)